MNVNEWISALEDCYQNNGRVFSENERSVFENSFPESLIEMVDSYSTRQACLSGAISLIDNMSLPENAMSQYNERCDLILNYFVHLYENGRTFGNINRIKETYGTSLNEKYNINSGLFFDFAKTYWTFKVEIMDLFNIYSSNKLFISHILVKCEVFIAQIFFPSPGPNSVSESERIVAQKEFLKTFSLSTDVDAFISSNPTITTDWDDIA